MNNLVTDGGKDLKALVSLHVKGISRPEIRTVSKTQVEVKLFNISSSKEKRKESGPSIDVSNAPHPPWLADLFLWLLGLQRFPVGSVTVGAVVFTVVVRCFGISHYQQLLDVTLQETEG